MLDPAHTIQDVETLERIYGPPVEAAVIKEVDRIHPVYRPFIETSPFVILATSGPEGLDASPRGGAPGFVMVEDERTLLMPDRPGNNRVDSLRNIVRDPRVGLLFLVPGCGETLRVNGTAFLSRDPALMQRFTEDGKEPRSVVVVRVETVFIQCSRAVTRSGLWNPEKQIERTTLPGLGPMLSALREEWARQPVPTS